MSSSSDDDDSFPNTSIAPWIQSSVSQIPGYVTRAPDDPDNVMQVLFVSCSLSVPCIVGHRDGSAQAVVRVSTLKKKLIVCWLVA